MPVIPSAVRQAVMEAECEARGHQVNPHEVLGTSDIPKDSDPLKWPSMNCDRCGVTWLVVPYPGKDYEDAERILYGAMNPARPAVKLMLRNRQLRAERDA